MDGFRKIMGGQMKNMLFKREYDDGCFQVIVDSILFKQKYLLESAMSETNDKKATFYIFDNVNLFYFKPVLLQELSQGALVCAYALGNTQSV